MSSLAPTRAAPRISVRVLLFATYADLVGKDLVACELTAPATVADAVRHLRETLPGASRIPERPLVAVNQVHARSETALADGDEIAILPPLAGG